MVGNVVERMGEEDTADIDRAAEQEELRLHGLRILARMIVRAYLQDRLQGTDAKSRTADEPVRATTPPIPDPGQP